MHDVMLFMGTVLMGFFAIMNPIANTPIFLALTGGMDSRRKKNSVALRSVLFAFGIVAAFVVLGHMIFKAFGITLPAFLIAGGIILFIIGYDMLQGKSSRVHHPDPKTRDEIKEKASDPVAAGDIALTPLGIPILAGPGTISTAMNFTGISTGFGKVEQAIVVLIGFAVICLITFIAFISANRIQDFLGKQVINVISRIMGLILTLIATQMVILGVKNAIEMYS